MESSTILLEKSLFTERFITVSKLLYSMEITVRSVEHAQLLEMLPDLKQMYKLQSAEDRVEDVESIIETVESEEYDAEPDVWKHTLIGLRTDYIKNRHGGLRPWWLTQKLARRLEAKEKYDE